MDVAITDLRANLGTWLDVARSGGELVVTDRGTPVARIVGIDATPALERLTQQGVIGRPARPGRPVAGGRGRPAPRRPVADIVEDQRR